MEVQGGALSPNAVAEFLQRLDDSPYFSEPSLRSMQDSGNFHSFNLTCNFTYTPGKEKTAEEPAAPKPKPPAPRGGKAPGAGDSLE